MQLVTSLYFYSLAHRCLLTIPNACTQNGDIYPYPSYYHNVTGSNNYDNFLTMDSPASFDYYAKYLNQDRYAGVHVNLANRDGDRLKDK